MFSAIWKFIKGLFPVKERRSFTLDLKEDLIREMAAQDARRVPSHPPTDWQGINWKEPDAKHENRYADDIMISEVERSISTKVQEVINQEVEEWHETVNDAKRRLDDVLHKLEEKVSAYRQHLAQLRKRWPDARPESRGGRFTALGTVVAILVLTLLDWFINVRSFHYMNRPTFEIIMFSLMIGISIPLAGHVCGKYSKHRPKELATWIKILLPIPFALAALYFLSDAREQSFKALGMNPDASSTTVLLFGLVNSIILMYTIYIANKASYTYPLLNKLHQEIAELKTEYDSLTSDLRESVDEINDKIIELVHKGEKAQLIYQDENRRFRSDPLPAYFQRTDMLLIELTPEVRSFFERSHPYLKYCEYLADSGDNSLERAEALFASLNQKLETT
jgi:hypothetical protein